MRSGSARILLGAIACLVAHAPARASCTAATACARAAPDAEQEAAVWALLLPRVQAGKPVVAAIAEEIARPGSDVIRPVVAILLGESVEPEVEYEIHPSAIDLRQQILVESLRRLHVKEAVLGLRSHLRNDTSVDARLLVIQVLSELGGVDAFDGAVWIAAALDPVQWERVFVQTQVEVSIDRLVARNPRLVRRLAQALADAPPPFAALLARALTTSRPVTALPALMACLGRDPVLDLCVLEQLARIGDQGDPGFESEGMRRLRAMIYTSDDDAQRAAAIALGRMGDGESRVGLVALLDDVDSLTAAAARTALETLSGLRLGTDRAAWAAWCARENQWLEERLPLLAESLASPEVPVVTASLDEMLLHRVHRHQVALAMRPALSAEDPAAQRLACEVLARLGSPRALPWFLEKLDSPHADVRRAAWKGLRDITRLDLPMSAANWRIGLAP